MRYKTTNNELELSFKNATNIKDDYFSVIFEQANFTIYDLNLSNNEFFISNEFHNQIISNYNGNNILNQMFDLNFIHPDDVIKFSNYINNEIKEISFNSFTYRRRKQNGAYAWIRSSIYNIFNDCGDLIRVYGTIHNISTEKQFVSSKISKSTSLIDIPNMFQFTIAADSLLKKNIGKNYTMVVFDINKFSLINDLYGSEIGDKVLHYIGSTLKNYISVPNLFCRMYADHFALLLENSHDIDFAILIINLAEEIANNPLQLEVMLSFGICKVHYSDVDIASLCNRANLAKGTIKGNRLQLLAVYEE